MTKIQKKKESLIIVLHEIYGINQHIKSFCEILSDQDYDVICPNLLEQDGPFDYSEEMIAYRHFMENVGFMGAVKKIKNLLLDVRVQYRKIYLIGFSVGATVAWVCSEEEGLNGIVGYYGSRIRSYKEIVPKCPAILFFPEQEPSFNVDELISYLNRRNIEIHKLNGQHGFSDPYSTKYNAESSRSAFNETLAFLKKYGEK
ncbi:dienelactone hydrolase family protein [Bacillus sp. BRMEA1]|uniref:dienelactone hydrolase family protein n=1 Tax=Neobacillus endophyticus TaxID=2738405 RepID=UPI001565D228|nr:dienelactone hydrolase family protein [Neobacillus endophyticus]NRD77078.1 dienelactone hydrolase family protein [Neobacillus endophyticus]